LSIKLLNLSRTTRPCHRREQCLGLKTVEQKQCVLVEGEDFLVTATPTASRWDWKRVVLSRGLCRRIGGLCGRAALLRGTIMTSGHLTQQPLKAAWVDICTACFDCTVSFVVYINWIAGWVDKRVGPGLLGEGKILCSCRKLNHDSSVIYVVG